MSSFQTYIHRFLGGLLLIPFHKFCIASTRDDVTEIVGRIIPNADAGGSISYVSIANEIMYWMFALVGIIAVLYIVWVGAKLLWAPGNMEEVTKSMKSLGYIIIGLALIPFAWFIISFLTNLNI